MGVRPVPGPRRNRAAAGGGGPRGWRQCPADGNPLPCQCCRGTGGAAAAQAGHYWRRCVMAFCQCCVFLTQQVFICIGENSNAQSKMMFVFFPRSLLNQAPKWNFSIVFLQVRVRVSPQPPGKCK